MDKIEDIDQYIIEKENSEKIESRSKLSDFWLNEDIKQGQKMLKSTMSSQFDIKLDNKINSHMQWHLREA